MKTNYQLAERLQTLRKSHGYSQEQLADLLDISRQAVSKWESGSSQPDIDNLVRLSQLYNATLDSIVTGADQASFAQQASEPSKVVIVPPFGMGMFRFQLWHYEYKSKATLWGLPLLHVNLGRTDNGRLAAAKGIVAVGSCAMGLLSVGVFSLGLVSVGVLALGLVTLAVLGAGLLAAGIVSAGLLAFGTVALGYFAVGVSAIGVYSGGVAAIASKVAVGVAASAPVAIAKEKADGLYTMLVTASTTVQEVWGFIDAHTATKPYRIMEILAKMSQWL